jgi:catechol 2,3-dioxygenase-like lactoylglutathione lyase family enzyme
MTTSAGLDHFPIMAFVSIRDAERAKAFYRDTLGLRLIGEELPFALVFDAHGVVLRLSLDPQAAPIRGTVLGWRVPDIDSAVARLVGAGVVLERYSFLEQDGTGVWNSPNGARVAWFKDPDGNVLSLSQHPD